MDRLTQAYAALGSAEAQLRVGGDALIRDLVQESMSLLRAEIIARMVREEREGRAA